MAKRKQPGKRLIRPKTTAILAAVPAGLLDDLRTLIRQTREGVAQAVNSALVLLYWQVGQRIRTQLGAHRALTQDQEMPGREPPPEKTPGVFGLTNRHVAQG